MFTRAAALEWARDGIRVVGISPGFTDTEMVAHVVERLEADNIPLNPLGRLADPSEVAELIAYLASERAAQITGALIAIDGGETITVPR
jgi:3-oxoacyl-[acyl-carrier protein] reductase